MIENFKIQLIVRVHVCAFYKKDILLKSTVHSKRGWMKNESRDLIFGTLSTLKGERKEWVWRRSHGKTARDCRTETSCGMSRDPTELLRKETFGRHPAPIDLSSWNIMVPLYIRLNMIISYCYIILIIKTMVYN